MTLLDKKRGTHLFALSRAPQRSSRPLTPPGLYVTILARGFASFVRVIGASEAVIAFSVLVVVSLKSQFSSAVSAEHISGEKAACKQFLVGVRPCAVLYSLMGVVPEPLRDNGFVRVLKEQFFIISAESALIRFEAGGNGLSQNGMTEIFLSVQYFSDCIAAPIAVTDFSFHIALLRVVLQGIS